MRPGERRCVVHLRLPRRCVCVASALRLCCVCAASALRLRCVCVPTALRLRCVGCGIPTSPPYLAPEFRLKPSKIPTIPTVPTELSDPPWGPAGIPTTSSSSRGPGGLKFGAPSPPPGNPVGTVGTVGIFRVFSRNSGGWQGVSRNSDWAFLLPSPPGNPVAGADFCVPRWDSD